MAMSDRIYDRLANIFVLVAVASALFFNGESRWHWLTGALGACAGIAAIVLYFTNQSREEKKPDTSKSVEATSAVEKVLHEAMSRQQQEPLAISQTWVTKIGAEAGQYAMLAYLTGNAKVSRFYMDRHAVRHGLGLYYSAYVREAFAQQPESQELTPFSVSEIAACAVEIIRTLSAGDDHDRWEYVFGPDGLRVVAAKSAKDKLGVRDRTKIGDQEFGFGQMSETIQ